MLREVLFILKKIVETTESIFLNSSYYVLKIFDPKYNTITNKCIILQFYVYKYSIRNFNMKFRTIIKLQFCE